MGFQKSFNLNYRLEWLYEIITVNPNGNGTVLGDRPFYVEAHENSEIKIAFYNSQNLKSVKYINYDPTYENFLMTGLIDQIPTDKRLKEISDFTREFTFGIQNVESPEQDMANKVFIIETEESEHPYKGTMKLAFWLTCRESLQKGVCPEAKLKFNYKLLDYSLIKEE